TPLLNLAQTWNTSGQPTGVLLNITNTASAAGSLLMDLQTGGTTNFRVTSATSAVTRVDINYVSTSAFGTYRFLENGTVAGSFEFVGSLSSLTNRRNGLGMVSVAGPIQFLPNGGSNIYGNVTSSAFSVSSGLSIGWSNNSTDATTT